GEEERHAETEEVRPTPDGTKRPQARRVVGVEGAQVRSDGFRALEVHDGSEDAVCNCALELGGRSHEPEAVLRVLVPGDELRDACVCVRAGRAAIDGAGWRD